MRYLRAPDLQRSYSIGADWLELLALVREKRVATDADILQPNALLDDRAAMATPSPTEIPEDPDIIEPAVERALDALFDELAQRKEALNEYYPFDLTITERRLRVAASEPIEDELASTGRAIYIACLFMSAIRSGLVDAKTAGIPTDPAMGNLFQICATLAAAGYLSGDAYWFGHPRPDQTPLLDAVSHLTRLVGTGTARLQRPPGETKFAKDGGIDVVAWRDHQDRRPSKLILYGQCASGVGWEGKPVKGKVDRLDSYYTLPPSKHWIPAFFTPFPLYMDKENAHDLRGEEERRGFYRQYEAEMGIIIDRSRIVMWAVEALRDIRPSAKDAADRLPELFEWSDRALGTTRDQG
jgi:hypothetical protein